MSLGESMLFAAIMTLMDEIKNKDIKNTSVNTTLSNNEVNINFAFDNLHAKDNLVALANSLYEKADEVTGEKTEIDTDILISGMLTGIIYETVLATDGDYEKKKALYNYSLKYCNVITDFTWDLLDSSDKSFENILFQITERCLDTIFVASTVSRGDEISTKFIQLLSELMLHLEDAISKCFATINFSKRLPLVALDRIIAAMEKEVHRLEEEYPSLKKQATPKIDNDNMLRLRTNARAEREAENMSSAAAYYREILKIAPDDWEAILYSDLCSLYAVSHNINSNKISDCTIKISNCISETIPLAKNQIFSRTDLIIDMTNVVTWITKLATNYFVASMNAFKASSGGYTANMSKTLQVSGIINMTFVLGDTLEEVFADDQEIAKNLSCVCWETGFICYENCNMPVPPKMYEHYLKIIKYNPSFRCSKPLIDGKSNSSTGGCYIATAVYGSYDCQQVWTLRRYRDYSLAKSWLGRSFIRFYYATSPTLVKLFGRTNWFNVGSRKILDKLVNKLMADGYKNTPYADGINKDNAEDEKNG